MKGLAKERRRQEIGLTERACLVLEQTRQLIQERREQAAARREQFLIREDKIARGTLGNQR